MIDVTAATNRDLYLEVMAVVGKRHAVERSMADYLIALRDALVQYREAHSLTPDEFVSAIAAGFDADGRPIDPDAWRHEDLTVEEDADDRPGSFDDVDRTLRSQILDQLDAQETGKDRDEYRHFGLEVPRRGSGERSTDSYWFNWDPAGFVECGMTGSFGGWEPGDEGGRELVPGEVAVIGPGGEITTAAPEDLVDSPRPLTEITWADVLDFLWAGQSYE